MCDENLLISVIVTAYNIEAYLPGCLDSLTAQTWPFMEIILVDDGSTDDTPRICDAYAAQYSQIRVLHQVNGGPSAARNAGLLMARGTYIGYVDGDDWVEKDMYESMLNACRRTGAQIAICSYRQVGKGGEAIHPTGNVLELTREETLEWYISGHPSYHIYHSVWSKLFERSVIEDLWFARGRKSEDIMYSTRALCAASKCVFLDTPYYNYRMDREGSIMNSSVHERRFQDEIPFWKEQICFLREQGMGELSEKAAYQFYRKMLFYYVDFRQQKMKKSAVELADFLKSEKEKIGEVYSRHFTAAGDRVRMKLFLLCPAAYYAAVRLYDRVIIPLRQ